jgi:hypothetical protein
VEIRALVRNHQQKSGWNNEGRLFLLLSDTVRRRRSDLAGLGHVTVPETRIEDTSPLSNYWKEERNNGAASTPSECFDWDPIEPFSRFERQLSRLLDDVRLSLGALATDFDFSPAADIEETDVAFVVEIELPEVTKEDINVEISSRRLSVSGERKERSCFVPSRPPGVLWFT